MEHCQRLHDYAYLIQQVRHYTDQGLTLEAAIDRAVEDCIHQNVMKEFLLIHRGEVCEVILTEHDHELHLRSEKRLSFEEGVEAGEQRNIQQSVHFMILDHLELNVPVERIMRKLRDRYHLTADEALQYLQQSMNKQT